MTPPSTSSATSMSPSDAPPGRVVVVGHPGHKRVTLFQEALARRGLPPAQVVAWRDVLTGQDDLERAVGGGALVRVESPGQDFEVEKLLLAAGAEVEETEDPGADFLPAAEALRLEFDRGRLLYPRQWYHGFRATLRRLLQRLDGQPSVRWMSHPEDVITMFDKRACHALLRTAGVPVPAGLGPVRSYAELLERVRATGRWRVFVKLACGSSASGVVAFATNGSRVRAVTTAELVHQDGSWRVYNSRRIRAYEEPADVAALIDLICREGAQVEEWVPKAGTQGCAFDLRVLVIAGRERHTVVRLSETPMTNLHLLNRRGDLGQLREEIPEEYWEAAVGNCRKAAALFPRSLHAGVDLLFAPGFRRHAVLEVNAFGDSLPGVMCDGMDTYEAELSAVPFFRSSGREGEVRYGRPLS